MKTIHCTRCDNLVFVENVSCNQCLAVLGFLPALQEICAFEGDDEIGWKTSHARTGQTFRRCALSQAERRGSRDVRDRRLIGQGAACR